MALPLFGGLQQTTTSKNLVEFKAGKMTQKGKMVHPDTRKGLIYIYKSEDSLTHFCWKDRTSGEVVDDLIIFPDDADFSRIPQCTTGRVYLMKFRSSSRRFFCWMQDASAENDEANCKKINELLNGPSEPTNTEKAIEKPPTSGENGSKPGATSIAPTSAPGNNVTAAHLQNILNIVNTNQQAPDLGTPQTMSVSAANVITKEAVDSLLKCPNTVAKLENHLPEQLKGSPEALRQTLNSPQFQQGLQIFSTAFKSGQLAPVMKTLGFTDSAGNAAAGGDFEAFVKAVAEVTGKTQEEEEEMALD